MELNVETYFDIAQSQKDAAINHIHLDENIVTQSSLLLHYQVRAAAARKQFEISKSFGEAMEAKLYASWRETLTEKGKATEAQIDAAVKSDPRWFKIQKHIIESREQFELASGAVDSMRDRKDLLLSLANDRRKERDGEIRLGATKSITDELRSNVLRQLGGEAA